MKRYEYYMILQEKYTDINVFSEIERTCRKIEEHFETHNNILVSVSGGSDSDCIVHLVCTYFPEFIDKCKFVFVNTGLEYDATKRHLCDLEKRYGITIDRIRGKSVVTVIREYGVPVLNKSRSEDIYYYLRGAEWAMRKEYAHKRNMVEMIHYAKENGIKISSRCCLISKKRPLCEYMKKNCCDLNVTGERKAGGGHRAASHKFMPLFWWSDMVKATFKKAEKIRYSDCYEVYGMKRTGCCGCPFNPNVGRDLQSMWEYEPRLFKACMNVFGQAYELTDMFGCRRVKCLPEYWQMRLENA